MTGLPRAKNVSRAQDAWSIMVCGGVEMLTTRLLRGDAFTDKALNDMKSLRRRLDAFGSALDGRITVSENSE